MWYSEQSDRIEAAAPVENNLQLQWNQADFAALKKTESPQNYTLSQNDMVSLNMDTDTLFKNMDSFGGKNKESRHSANQNDNPQSSSTPAELEEQAQEAKDKLEQMGQTVSGAEDSAPQRLMQNIKGDFNTGMGAGSPYDNNDTDVIDINGGRNDVQVIDITPYMH